MPDRRQRECTTAETIAKSKINAIKVRDGDPSREEVLRAVLVKLQSRFQDRSEAASTVADDSSPEQAPESTTAPANHEALERLNDVERACLESMREDFDRGIVLINEKANEDSYKDALEKDKTAGQSWEAVQRRLVNHDGATPLLKKAVELSKRTGGQEGKGACLVGVYENGELAIRQRSQEIVNVIQTKKGQLRLAFHPEAKLEEGERWAKAVEIVRAVKAAGYHVPADAPDYNKEGLVAASEAVTGDYVASPNRDEWRSVMLECPDDVSDDAFVRIVGFFPECGDAGVTDVRARARNVNCGAVLWLRG